MHRRIVRYTNGTADPVDDILVEEAPVELRLGDVPIAVLMRTPGNEEELGLGFAITEGIVLGPHEVAGVRLTDEADGVVVADAVKFVFKEGAKVP